MASNKGEEENNRWVQMGKNMIHGVKLVLI